MLFKNMILKTVYVILDLFYDYLHGSIFYAPAKAAMLNIPSKRCLKVS